MLDLTAQEVAQDRTRFGNVLETLSLAAQQAQHNGPGRLPADVPYTSPEYANSRSSSRTPPGNWSASKSKAAATVKASDLRGLKNGLPGRYAIQARAGICDGTETLPLGDGLWAAPLSSLSGD